MKRIKTSGKISLMAVFLILSLLITSSLVFAQPESGNEYQGMIFSADASTDDYTNAIFVEKEVISGEPEGVASYKISLSTQDGSEIDSIYLADGEKGEFSDLDGKTTYVLEETALFDGSDDQSLPGNLSISYSGDIDSSSHKVIADWGGPTYLYCHITNAGSTVKDYVYDNPKWELWYNASGYAEDGDIIYSSALTDDQLQDLYGTDVIEGQTTITVSAWDLYDAGYSLAAGDYVFRIEQPQGYSESYCWSDDTTAEGEIRCVTVSNTFTHTLTIVKEVVGEYEGDPFIFAVGGHGENSLSPISLNNGESSSTPGLTGQRFVSEASDGDADRTTYAVNGEPVKPKDGHVCVDLTNEDQTVKVTNYFYEDNQLIVEKKIGSGTSTREYYTVELQKWVCPYILSFQSIKVAAAEPITGQCSWQPVYSFEIAVSDPWMMPLSDLIASYGSGQYRVVETGTNDISKWKSLSYSLNGNGVSEASFYLNSDAAVVINDEIIDGPTTVEITNNFKTGGSNGGDTWPKVTIEKEIGEGTATQDSFTVELQKDNDGDWDVVKTITVTPDEEVTVYMQQYGAGTYRVVEVDTDEIDKFDSLSYSTSGDTGDEENEFEVVKNGRNSSVVITNNFEEEQEEEVVPEITEPAAPVVVPEPAPELPKTGAAPIAAGLGLILAAGGLAIRRIKK